jgi:hypothetical protein
MVCQQRLCRAAGQWEAACVHVLPCGSCLGVQMHQSRGYANSHVQACCLFVQQMRTENPSAWSSALCSVFCHALGPAAHTQCFAFTRWFELCCSATAGLGSLLSRHMLPMFDGVGGSLLRALVTWHGDNPSRADVCFLRMTCSAWPCPSPA